MIPQSPTSTTVQSIRPEADSKTPEPSIKLISKTIFPTITGLKPHRRPARNYRHWGVQKAWDGRDGMIPDLGPDPF